MEHISEINKKIAKNLTSYRKAAGFTQAELAEKINYSDKSVSKWESGNGLPDVYTLMQLAELYGVTLNELVGEDTPIKREKSTRSLHTWVMLLSSGIVWLVATCVFVLLQLCVPQVDKWWMCFVYAVFVNSIVLIVFTGIWKHKILSFLSVSTLIWSSILCVYLTLHYLALWQGWTLDALWMLFLLGVPLQVLECMWGLFRRNTGRKKKKKQAKAEEPLAENVQEQE